MTINSKYQPVLAFATVFLLVAALSNPDRSQAADGAVSLQPSNPPQDLRDVRWQRVGPQLMALHEKYASHKARAATQAFDPQIPYLRIANDMVVIDTAADGDVDELKAALAKLGAVDIVSFRRVVSARLPLAAIPALADVKTLRFARPSMAMTRVGDTTSQGDAAMKTDDARIAIPAGFGVDGTGVTVGAMSDTFDCGAATPGDYATDIATLDLPSGIEVVDDTACGTFSIDEGRGILQLIHDVAPGADLAFHTAFGGAADFALGIQELAGCPPGSEPGCMPAASPAHVIVDDVFYLEQPFFLDGIIAQAVDVVHDAGVAYFSAAGNDARASWEGGFVSSGIEPPGYPFSSGDAHDFDPGPGVDIYQKVFFPGPTVLTLQWDEPFLTVSGPPGSANNLDICVFPDPPPPAATGPIDCTATVNLFFDPVDVLDVPGPGTFNIAIIKDTFSPMPDPGLMKYIVFNDAFSVDESYPGALKSTVFGHPNARGAVGVGAALYFFTPEFGTDPPVLEPFSSAGGTPILFDEDGMLLSVPEVRLRPQIVGPDGTNTTFFGAPDTPPGECCEGDSFPNFFGTSASAPHLAGLAALMLEANPDLTPIGVEDVLTSSAHDMGPAGFDFDSGFGFVDGFDAVGSVDDSLFCDGVDDLDLFGSPGPGTFSAKSSIRLGDGDFSDFTGIADMHIFADGFESGDTSAWSNSCP